MGIKGKHHGLFSDNTLSWFQRFLFPISQSKMSHEAVKTCCEVTSKNGMGFLLTRNTLITPIKDHCWWQTVKSETRLCSVEEHKGTKWSKMLLVSHFMLFEHNQDQPAFIDLPFKVIP